MKSILSQEEKKYLNRVCRYLGSLGMRDGLVELDTSDYGGVSCENLDWSKFTVFSNNYTAEIPDGLIPIMKKISDYVCENDMISTPDVDDLNFERLTIEIDCDTKEISMTHDYSYYSTGDGMTTTFEINDYDDLIDIFDTLESDDEITDRVLTLEYNGSGDSGFIEDSFSNGDSVPSDVQDWCYNRLESLHGGWEINEGSQGTFEIDLDRKEITLNHIYNTEESERDTLWEEKF